MSSLIQIHLGFFFLSFSQHGACVSILVQALSRLDDFQHCGVLKCSFLNLKTCIQKNMTEYFVSYDMQFMIYVLMGNVSVFLSAFQIFLENSYILH